MKLGYKIILGAFLLSLLSYPSILVFNKYSQFKKLQTEESQALLKTFKTRPENFYTNINYESLVKSFAEKDIKTIDIDLNAKDEPLKVPVTETTLAALDVSQTTAGSITGESSVITEASVTTETQTPVALPKETKKAIETKPKETEKKVVIAGTPVQEKKVDELQYYIQLGVFKSQDNANKLLHKVGSGFVVVTSSVNDKQYIVRSNPGNKEDIEILSDRVAKKDSSITPIIRVW